MTMFTKTKLALSAAIILAAASAAVAAGSESAQGGFHVLPNGIRVAPSTRRPVSSAEFITKAKISSNQARETALHTFDGEVLHQRVDREKGGSGLRYSFGIVNGPTAHEVGVDAISGEVLEDSVCRRGLLGTECRK